MIILLSMAILFPLFYTPWFDDYYYFPKLLMLTILSLAALIHILLKFRSIELNRFKKLPGKFLLTGFILFIIISTLFSPYEDIVFFGTFTRHTGFYFYIYTFILFLYSYLILTHNKIIIIFKAFVFTSIPISIYGILLSYGIWPQFYENQVFFYGYRSSSTIGNPNFLGTYLYLMFVLGCYLYFKNHRWFYLFSILIIYACLLTSQTRSAWLSSVIIFICIIIVNWKNGGYWKNLSNWSLYIGLFSVSLIIFLTNPQFNERLYTSAVELLQEDQKDPGHFGSSRGIIWGNSVKTFQNSSIKELLIGTGPDTFYKRVYFSPEEKETYFNTTEIEVDKAHNIFLETLLTLGIPAFLCLYLLYSRFITFNNNSISTYLSLLLIGYLIQGFFNIDVVSVYPIFIILLSILAYCKSYAIE